MPAWLMPQMKNFWFIAPLILAAGSFALMTLPSYANNANQAPASDAAHKMAVELFERAVSMRERCYATPAERLELVQRAITLCPDEPVLYCELAVEYRLLSDYPAALDAAKQAIKLDATCAAAWEEEGLALVQLQGTQVGIAALEKSAQLDPENPEIWLTLADHRRNTSPAAAEGAYKTCLRLIRLPARKVRLIRYPNDTLEVLCLSSLGGLRFCAKRYLEAKEFYEEAKAADVDHKESLLIDGQIEKVEKQIRLQQESPAK